MRREKASLVKNKVKAFQRNETFDQASEGSYSETRGLIGRTTALRYSKRRKHLSVEGTVATENDLQQVLLEIIKSWVAK